MCMYVYTLLCYIHVYIYIYIQYILYRSTGNKHGPASPSRHELNTDHGILRLSSLEPKCEQHTTPFRETWLSQARAWSTPPCFDLGSATSDIILFSITIARLCFQHLCVPFRSPPDLTRPMACRNSTGLHDCKCPNSPPTLLPFQKRQLAHDMMYYNTT